MKSRKWFITINVGAECYSNVQTILNEERQCLYYLILHDKDNEEQPHYHLCLNYSNARTFDGMLNKFKGSHISVCEYWNKSIQYLVHANDKEKFQYPYTEIITNDSENNLFEFLMLDEFEKLSTTNLIMALENKEINSFSECVKRWGVNQCGLKVNLLKTLLEEHHSLVETEKRVDVRIKEVQAFYENAAYNMVKDLISKINVVYEFYGLSPMVAEDYFLNEWINYVGKGVSKNVNIR